MLLKRLRLLLAVICCCPPLACGSPPEAKSPEASRDAESEPESGGGDVSEAEEASGAGSESDSGSEASAKLPAPDTKATDRRSLVMDFAMTLLRGEAAAGVQTGNWSFMEERTHLVVDVGTTAVTKLKVVYGKWEAKPLLGLTYEVPTDGNTYAVTESGVERIGGAELTPEERSAVFSEYGWVGGPHPVVAAIDAAGGEPGSELAVDSRFIHALVGAIPGVDHDKSTMKARFEGFDAAGRKSAKLHVALTAELRSGDTSFTLELEGPASVDMATGWTRSLELAGKLRPGGQVKVKGKMLNVRGKGNAKLTRAAEFR